MTNSKLTNILLWCCMFFLISCYNGRSNKKLNANSPVQAARILSDQKWMEDFEQLYRLLKTTHRDLYHKTNKEQFEQLFLEIKNIIPKLTDHEIIVQFARFVALVNDGHTRLTLPLQEGLGLGQAHSKTPYPSNDRLLFRVLPVEFYWFDDGLYIIKASKLHENLIGKKVLSINDTPIEEALESARQLAHFDNESGYKLIAPSRLSILETLQGLKIAKNDADGVVLTIQNGETKERIAIEALDRFTQERLSGTSLSTKKQEDTYYSYEYLAGRNALYVKINRMNDAPTGPTLVQFLGKIDEMIKKKRVERLVLDLRNNFGGNNINTVPIVNLINKNSHLNKIGSFYTLIGRKTFSAAQNLVNDLSTWTNVVFVGEPTGASPSHYGDSKKTQLSNSNLTVRISSIYWRDASPDEKKEWTRPDIAVENNATDYFQNKDAALNVCLEFKTAPNWLDTYYRLCVSGGMNTAERLYTRFPLDWQHTQADFKALETMMVQRIFNKDPQ